MQAVSKFFSQRLYDESAFRYMYILSLFFSSVCFIEVPCQVATGIFMLWAAFIMTNKFLYKKSENNIKYTFWLICFVLTSFITSLLHIQDNFFMNLLMIYHVVICFFLFYGLHSQKDKQRLKREMFFLFKTIVIASTILTAVGLIIAILFSNVYLGGYFLGFRDNRFTSVYTNPNLSAFSGVISIICCHILIGKNSPWKSNTKIINNWLAFTCIIINILALFLSDSNASLLFLICYTGIYSFYNLYKTNYNMPLKTIFKNSLILLLIFVVSTFSTFLLRGVCQDGVSELINNIHQTDIMVVDGQLEKNSNYELEIGRKTSYDVSSGRIDSFKKALVLYGKNPFMGIGKGNILEYGNRYLAKGFSFSDLHNGYLTILISCGTIGIIIFMLFATLVASNIIRALQKGNFDSNEFPILFSAIGSYCLFACFEKALLFDITFMVVIFWLMLGYAMNYSVIYGNQGAKYNPIKLPFYNINPNSLAINKRFSPKYIKFKYNKILNRQ